MIVLATGIAIRDGRVLLVASQYADRPEPLWTLPGGRQEPGELLEETVRRELVEETGWNARVDALAYVSESYDGDRHYLNATFRVTLLDQAATPACDNDHVVDVQWVSLSEIEHRMTVAVVREPLLAYLGERLERRYAGYHDAGVTIRWPDEA